MNTLAIQTSTKVSVRVLWISLFVFLTGFGAQITIPLPFTPVPVTLQTLFVLSSGVVLGKDGLWSQLAYLILGGIGLPLFAGGVGNWTYLFGPTGGYLIGFVAASAFAGQWLYPVWASLSYGQRALRLLLVSLLVFVPGVIQLSLFLKISFTQSLMKGFFPFLPGDLFKVLVTAGIPNRFLRK